MFIENLFVKSLVLTYDVKWHISDLSFWIIKKKRDALQNTTEFGNDSHVKTEDSLRYILTESALTDT